MRSTSTLLTAFFLGAGHVFGQTATTNTPVATNAAPAAIEIEEENKWAFSASVYTYIVPDASDYAQPTITADRDWLHLEARYNYEALKTGSAWVVY